MHRARNEFLSRKEREKGGREGKNRGAASCRSRGTCCSSSALCARSCRRADAFFGAEAQDDNDSGGKREEGRGERGARSSFEPEMRKD